jgi:hypothetical protein
MITGQREPSHLKNLHNIITGQMEPSFEAERWENSYKEKIKVICREESNKGMFSAMPKTRTI